MKAHLSRTVGGQKADQKHDDDDHRDYHHLQCGMRRTTISDAVIELRLMRLEAPMLCGGPPQL